MYIANGVIQALWLLNQQIRQDARCITVHLSTTIVGVTLLLASKCAEKLTVNCLTEEKIQASGRLVAYQFSPVSALIK